MNVSIAISGADVVGTEKRNHGAAGDLFDPGDQVVAHHLLEGRACQQHELATIFLDERRFGFGQGGLQHDGTMSSLKNVRAFVGPRPVYWLRSRTVRLEIAALFDPPEEEWAVSVPASPGLQARLLPRLGPRGRTGDPFLRSGAGQSLVFLVMHGGDKESPTAGVAWCQAPASPRCDVFPACRPWWCKADCCPCAPRWPAFVGSGGSARVG
jgi:hypothetical protein